jgi:hypothetical protein
MRHLVRMRDMTNDILQSRKLTGRHFGDLSVGIKCLKWDEWWGGNLGLNSVASGLCPLVDCCEHSNELYDYLKARNFLIS